MQGLITTEHISFLLVFFEGLLSFFSPCVIPLIPIYISYLAGNAEKGADGTVLYSRKKTMFHTLFFVLGISFAFFLLGISFSALGSFFSGNKMLFSRIGGILIVLLGLVQVGFFELKFLQREHKLHLNLAQKRMNPVVAFVMGFTFSFAWTPCVGPALSSVLILASGAKSALTGNLLVLVYAAGFVIPFLVLGLFTTQALSFLKRRQNLLKYTIKAGGVLLILMGVMTFTGWMNGITGYLNSFGTTGAPSISTSETASVPQSSTVESSSEAASSAQTPRVIPAYDFTLTDQFGNEHTLSDYKGKVVFLNFWASWCGPCKMEMPHIEELYNEYGQNQGDDVVFISMANPKTDTAPNNMDGTVDEVKQFLTDGGYTYPSLMDETGEVFAQYRINALPTTFMIDRDGNIFGYVPGTLTKDMMISMIDQTLEGKRIP